MAAPAKQRKRVVVKGKKKRIIGVSSYFSRTSNASPPPAFAEGGVGIGNETNPPLPTLQPTTPPDVWVSPVREDFTFRGGCVTAPRYNKRLAPADVHTPSSVSSAC